jgi:hypothetical protein
MRPTHGPTLALSLHLALALSLGSALSGCDGIGEDSRLFGSAAKTYNLDFTEVRINRQSMDGTFHAMIVEYVNQKKGGLEEFPVKVIALAPVEAGQQKDLMTGGSITRVMPDAAQFPEMESGNVTFSNIEVGTHCSGEFYVTFKPAKQGSSSTTLNGEFSATVGKLGD